MTLQEIVWGEKYQKFRDLCRETQLEARKLNIPSGVVFAGVAWDYPTKFKEKVGATVKLAAEDILKFAEEAS